MGFICRVRIGFMSLVSLVPFLPFSCPTPEECGPTNHEGDMAKGIFPPDTFIFMVKAERERALKEAHAKPSSGSDEPIKSNGVIKSTSNGITTNGITNGKILGHDAVIMVKSEPNDEEGTEINGLTLTSKQSREGSPEKMDCDIALSIAQSPPRPRKSPLGRCSHSSAGSDNESIGSRSSCKSEKKLIVDEDMCNNSPPPLITRLRDPNSPPGHNSNSNSSLTSGVGLSPQSSTSNSSVVFTKLQGQRLSPNSSRVPSPLHQHAHSQMMGSHPFTTQSHLHARLTTGAMTSESRCSHHDPSPLVQAELRNMVEKADPLSVVTSTSLSFHHHPMYRINGVRPEVISGGAVTPNRNSSPGGTNQSSSPIHQQNGDRQYLNGGGGQARKSPNHISRSPNGSPQSNSGSSVSSLMGNGSIHSPGSGSNTIVAGGSLGVPNSTNGANNHHHVNLNRTPTVIMGEAGGVRTMLWSQNLPQELGIQSNGTSSPTNGHYGLPPLTNATTLNPIGHNSPPQNNDNYHHAVKGQLSMERLWAAEALNLSTGSNGNTNTPNPKSFNSSPPTNGHYQHHQIPNPHPEDDEYEQPMICMICEDRATGLHYGIITCEGYLTILLLPVSIQILTFQITSNHFPYNLLKFSLTWIHKINFSRFHPIILN